MVRLFFEKRFSKALAVISGKDLSHMDIDDALSIISSKVPSARIRYAVDQMALLGIELR